MTIALLIDGNLNWHGWSNRCWWLILASCFIFLYEWFWVRYFRSDRNLIDFYRPLVGVRVPGATFPILSFLCLALYGRALVLGFATFLLGVGHIGIHLSHEQELKAQLLNQVHRSHRRTVRKGEQKVDEKKIKMVARCLWNFGDHECRIYDLSL